MKAFRFCWWSRGKMEGSENTEERPVVNRGT